MLHRGRSPLANGLPLPLRNAGQDVQRQAAGRAASVDLVPDRQKRPLPILEVVLDQLAKVDDAPGQPVQLHDQERLGVPRLEHSKGSLESGPVQGLRAHPSVNDDLDQVEIVQLRVGLDLGALGIEAHAFVRLLFGADSKVRNRSCVRHAASHRPMSSIMQRCKSMSSTTAKRCNGLRVPGGDPLFRPAFAFEKQVATRTHTARRSEACQLRGVPAPSAVRSHRPDCAVVSWSVNPHPHVLKALKSEVVVFDAASSVRYACRPSTSRRRRRGT